MAINEYKLPDVSVSVETNITPKDVADMFMCMNNVEMGEFFSSLGKIMSQSVGQFNTEVQMLSVPALDVHGRLAVRMIAMTQEKTNDA